MRPAKHLMRDPDVVPTDDYDMFEQISDQGSLVAYQDWDSGGPGAGAGRVSVYEYEGEFYVSHDAGIDGPHKVWDSEKGFTYRR